MLSETRLIRRMLAGDPSARETFLETYSTLIYSVLSRLCGIPETRLSDSFDYVFTKLLEDDGRRLRSWRGESPLATYLMALTRNLGRDYRVREFGRESWMGREGEDEVSSLSDGSAPTPEDEVIVSRMEGVMGGLVDSLEEMCRQIIDHRFRRHMSYKEIAFASAVTVSRVEVRLHRCLETLARLMKKKFPDLFEDRFNLDL